MSGFRGSGYGWPLGIHARVRLALHEGHERCPIGCGPDVEPSRHFDGAPSGELVTRCVSPGLGCRRGIARPTGALPDLLHRCRARPDHPSSSNSMLTRGRGGIVRRGRWTGIVARASAKEERHQDGDGARLHAHIMSDGGRPRWVPRSTLIGNSVRLNARAERQIRMVHPGRSQG